MTSVVTTTCKIKRVIESNPTWEGAGVRLNRVFGYNELPFFDPFLLLDDFSSMNPDNYIQGFPWHPHRGIETITYMVKGSIKHRDSLKNQGIIQSGDVQWMTAGGGIIHEEMPQKTEGYMCGFQLWANLPKSQKLMNPRYQEIKSDEIPMIAPKKGVHIRLIAGEFQKIRGPVRDIVTEPNYLDVMIAPDITYEHPMKEDHNVFAYVFEGSAYFDEKKDQLIQEKQCVLLEQGQSIKITTEENDVRFLLISGKPLNEPIAWKGPIVMNTQKELLKAFQDYRNGTFIKEI